MTPVRVLVLAVGLLASPAVAVAAPDWAGITTPFPGPAEPIGGPAAGCLAGGVALPADGVGYQVLRPARNRVWGHPVTIAFLRDLAAAAHAEGLPGLLIGDIAQPRGGPLPSGHASHQTGLDADIWFRLADRPLSPTDLAMPVPLSMIRDGAIDRAAFGAAQARLVELAATAAEIDRIFVHPLIKQALCETTPAARRGWLGRVRPWWGHHEHFHVRMACPPGGGRCEPMSPPPEGDGCGAELASWLTPPSVPPKARPPVPPRPLPSACLDLAIPR